MKRIDCDSIIFDMDGVLVSNSSYCQAIKETVELFLFKKFGIKKIVNAKYIEAVKKIKGFNNDWDTSYALIKLLGAGNKIKQFPLQIEFVTPKIRKSRQYREIKDLFQSVYLGDKLNGLITRELLLIEMELLKSLSERYPLGIATSRPKFEALFAVRNLKISPRFIKEEYIVAKEDCQKEKPYPDPLLEAKKRIKANKAVYIGDTINDVIAAQKAEMVCIYVGNENIGDYRVNKVNQIKELLL